MHVCMYVCMYTLCNCYLLWFLMYLLGVLETILAERIACDSYRCRVSVYEMDDPDRTCKDRNVCMDACMYVYSICVRVCMYICMYVVHICIQFTCIYSLEIVLALTSL